MVWDPAIYMAFGDERTRPAIELLARIRSENPSHVIDLGCGPGNSTAVLAARWPNATLQGLDDHRALIPRLMGSIQPGGTFAFQVPHNMNAPSHVLMREAAAAGPWSSKLDGVREVAV